MKKKLLSLILLSALFLLVACTNNGQATQPPHGAISPTATAQPQKTPARTASVLISADKAHYSRSEKIMVTITNNLSTAIYSSNYYTDCMPVQLQIKSAASWTALGRCPEATQSVFVLGPGSATGILLHPVIGPMVSRPGSSASWAAGVYRISFSYVLQPDPDTFHAGIEIVSEVFTIDP